jgi:galactose mutarotase-like enzyme
LSLVTIQNGVLTVQISTLGAELRSVKDSNDIERMWQGDPQYWTGRAPILFPVAGAFRDDVYELDDKRYSMPKHGFVRQLEWCVERNEGDTATFLMEQKHEGFPFAYKLRTHYFLDGPALNVAYEVTNFDTRPFYFSVGAHEGYATPEGIEAYTIVFDEEETLKRYEMSGNLLRRTTMTLAENTRELPLAAELFAKDPLVLQGLQSRGITLQSKLHGRTVRVEFPQHDTLVFWMLPGAKYICIEPWCNAPDFVDAELRIDRKPGFIRLAPYGVATRSHKIIVG